MCTASCSKGYLPYWETIIVGAARFAVAMGGEVPVEWHITVRMEELALVHRCGLRDPCSDVCAAM